MRAILASLVLLAPALGSAGEGDRARVDRDAMREAMVLPKRAVPYASSRAYLHYLRGQLAEAGGDLDAALLHLRDASIYDDSSDELRLARAWLHARTGSLDEAVGLVKRVLARRPAEAEAHLLLGKIRAAQRRKAEAAASLERALALAPHDAEAYLVLARLHAEFGEAEAAEAVARRHAAHFPGDGIAWRALAKIASERGDAGRLARYLEEAAAQDPSDAFSRRRLAASAEREGRREEAARLWAAALAIEPNDPDALLASGRLALHRGDDAGATAFFQQLLGTARDPVSAHLRVAGAYRGAGRLEEALAILAALRPDEPRAAFVRGMLLSKLGRQREAAAAFSQVPESLGELHLTALARSADCLSLEGRHDEALAVLGRALARISAGGDAADEVLDVVPDVYRRAGRVGEAVELLRRLAPGGAARSAHLALARALQDAGSDAEALGLLADAAAASPRDPRFVFALAAAKERTGDVRGAVALVEALLRADPDNPSALNFVGYVLADHGLRLDDAQRMIERALALVPDEPYFLDSLGWCELKRGKLERAIALLEKANELAPREPVLLQHLGEAYARAGRHTQATASWHQALQLLERDPDPRVRAQVESALRKLRAAASR